MWREDSARCNIQSIEADTAVVQLQNHILNCSFPILPEDWSVDPDVTVRTFVIRQEGAYNGYNSHNKGRTSYGFHTFMVGDFSLILDVKVQPGTENPASYLTTDGSPILGDLSRSHWSPVIRGDCENVFDELKNQMAGRAS